MQCVYTTPQFDANGQQTGVELIHVNTEDQDQRQIWDWIGQQVKAEGWAPQMIEVKYLTGKVVERSITIQYKMPSTVPQTNLVYGLLGADSAEALQNPEACVVSMGQQIGVAYDINSLHYQDPDTVDTTPGVESDWEVPGSPVGYPFGPAWKHWHEWTHAADGYQLHATYTGKSGARYIAIETPASAKKLTGTEMIWQVSQ